MSLFENNCSLAYSQETLTNAFTQSAHSVKTYEIKLDDMRAARKRKERLPEGAYLEPHHTHFLLVDNGTSGKFGTEIDFRARLESQIPSKESGMYSLTFDTS